MILISTVEISTDRIYDFSGTDTVSNSQGAGGKLTVVNKLRSGKINQNLGVLMNLDVSMDLDVLLKSSAKCVSPYNFCMELLE